MKESQGGADYIRLNNENPARRKPSDLSDEIRVAVVQTNPKGQPALPVHSQKQSFGGSTRNGDKVDREEVRIQQILFRQLFQCESVKHRLSLCKYLL